MKNTSRKSRKMPVSWGLVHFVGVPFPLLQLDKPDFDGWIVSYLPRVKSVPSKSSRVLPIALLIFFNSSRSISLEISDALTISYDFEPKLCSMGCTLHTILHLLKNLINV